MPGPLGLIGKPVGVMGPVGVKTSATKHGLGQTLGGISGAGREMVGTGILTLGIIYESPIDLPYLHI